MASHERRRGGLRSPAVGVLVAAALVAACGDREKPTSPGQPLGATGVRTFYFPVAIDYANPSVYLLPGSQSTLSAESTAAVEAALQPVSRDLAGVGKVFSWMGHNFSIGSAGGATIGRQDVNDLLRDRALRGCHDWGLLLSTLLRHFGLPAVMVDGAGIDWAEKFRAGQTTSFSGHVFVEVHVEGRWIVVDSTAGWYAANYDPREPVLPFTQSGDSRGFYVLYKGIDPAGYGVTSNEVLNARMSAFAQALPGITLFFPSYDLRPLPPG